MLIQLFVLLPTVPLSNEDKDYCQTTPNNDCAASRLIIWLLVSKEKVRGEPVRDRRDTVGNSDQSSPLGPWSWHNSCFPRYLKLLWSVTDT